MEPGPDLPERLHPGPGFKDWLMLCLSLAFVAAGALALRRKPDVGMVTIAFFGMCAAVAAAGVARKRRFRRQRPLQVRIAGGVPLRPPRGRSLMMGGGLLLVGVVLVVFGRAYGPLFWGLAWLFAVLGAWLSLAVAVGWLPSGYLQFDPLGMTLAYRRWSLTVPWTAVTHLQAGEVHNNPVVYLWFNRDAVTAHPPDRHATMQKHLARNESWLGAPLMLMTSHHGLDLPLLLAALERYSSDPAARAELAPPALLPN